MNKKTVFLNHYRGFIFKSASLAESTCFFYSIQMPYYSTSIFYPLLMPHNWSKRNPCMKEITPIRLNKATI